MLYFHNGNRTRNSDTPPKKLGCFYGVSSPQVIHSVVCTTFFFVSRALAICTTLTEKNQSHSDTTTSKRQANHKQRRPQPLPPPWWFDARSGAMCVLVTLCATQGMLCLFYFVRGGEFYNTFYQCTEIDFLPTRGDVEHGFCRRLWLSAARSSVICVLLTSWETS
jgi:hypothetical protein